MSRLKANRHSITTLIHLNFMETSGLEPRGISMPPKARIIRLLVLFVSMLSIISEASNYSQTVRGQTWSTTWSTTITDPSSGFTATLGTITIGTCAANQTSQPGYQCVTLPPSPSTPDWDVIAALIAFPVAIVGAGVLAIAYYRRPTSYSPTKHASSWVSVATLTGGGMLLVVCLWQLEIVDIAASNGSMWCPPFLLFPCIPWYIARDIWYLGVFAAFVLALIGAVNYARFAKLPDKPS